jgi:hypothetical protein
MRRIPNIAYGLEIITYIHNKPNHILYKTVDLEFTPWHENASINNHENNTEGYHGWTDGSGRISAAFRWSLRAYNDQGKQVEVEHNKGCLGEFETAFDGEMEAIANIMEYVIDNEIPGDLTIHSDAHAAIARVGHTGTGLWGRAGN